MMEDTSSHSEDENVETSSHSGSVLGDESPAPSPDFGSSARSSNQDRLNPGTIHLGEPFRDGSFTDCENHAVPFDRIKSVPNFSSHSGSDEAVMMQKCSIGALEGPSTSSCNKEQTSSKAGTLTSSSNSRKQLPWDNMQQWLYCVVIVTFDVELGQTIEQIYPPHVTLDAKEKSNICFLSFPDSNSGCMGDTIYSFRIRHASPTLKRLSNLQKHHFNVYAVNKYQAFQDYLYGAVHFRQLKDANIKRGYFQKSVVVLSSLPFVSLWMEVVRVIAEDFFVNAEVSLEAACHDIDQWPLPLPGSHLQLPLMGNVFEVTLPQQGQMTSQHGRRAVDIGYNDVNLTQRPRGDERISRVLGSVVDFDLYHCFHTLLPHIQLIWELVLLGQPIVVMGPSPDVTSKMVYALTSIIYPFKWGSDYRPYFTIHDSEFREFTLSAMGTSRRDEASRSPDTRGASSGHSTSEYPHNPPRIILGVTNPFFAKTLSHWPNLIRIGDVSTASNDANRQLEDVRNHKQKHSSKVVKGSKGSVRILDCKPGVYTNHKLFLEKDRTMVKKLLRGREHRKPPEVLSSWMRKFFRELTESFSIPLEHYLSTLMPLAKTVSPWKEPPQLKPFVPSDFLKHIEKAGPQLTSGLKGDWVGLYRYFLSSHNFNCWLLSRRTEINQRLQLVHLDAISQANLVNWLENKSEVEAVDLLIKLKEKLRRLSGGPPTRLQIDESVYQRIYEMMQLVVQKLPEDLKQSLLSNSLFTNAPFNKSAQVAPVQTSTESIENNTDVISSS